MTMTPPIVAFDSVSKTYQGPLPARTGGRGLARVSFGIEPGEVFALLGPNRAGKTTLLKILLGLCHPTRGRVERLGRPLSERSTLARVGYMHENQAFPALPDGRGLLEFYGGSRECPRARPAEPVPALLERVGLADRAREPIAASARGWSSASPWRRPCSPSPTSWSSTSRWKGST